MIGRQELQVVVPSRGSVPKHGAARRIAVDLNSSRTTKPGFVNVKDFVRLPAVSCGPQWPFPTAACLTSLPFHR